MTRVTWDDLEKFYSAGIEKGIFYPKNSPGVPWNGLLSVSEKADADPTTIFMDGQRIVNQSLPGVISGTITAFMYPDEFAPYDGVVKGITGQNRPPFGLSWRDNRELHILYNVTVSPSNNQYQTYGDDVNPISFAWDFDTVPVNVPGGKPSSHLVVMLDYAHASAVSDLEAVLYGDDANAPSLPTPQKVYDIFDLHADLRIIDNDDGTWTANYTGSDDGVITMLDDTTFQIDYPSAVVMTDTIYRIHSL